MDNYTERAITLKNLMDKFSGIIMENKNMKICTAIGNCFGTTSVPYERHVHTINIFQEKILN